MKKIAILSVAALALSLASCKKDYTCTCTVSSTANSTTVTYKKTYTKAKKGDAKAACVKRSMMEDNYKTTADCKLD